MAILGPGGFSAQPLISNTFLDREPHSPYAAMTASNRKPTNIAQAGCRCRRVDACSGVINSERPVSVVRPMPMERLLNAEIVATSMAVTLAVEYSLKRMAAPVKAANPRVW